MIQDFLKHGYEVVDFDEYADIYIINTCTVTNMSDRKSRQMLRRAKEKNQDSVIVAVGCYAQVAKEELEKMEDIDLILGTSEKNKIVEYIEKYRDEENQKFEEISDVMKQREFLDFGTTSYTEKTRAVIKVQDGCDRFCSYCIIPYARGRVRSRKIDSVVVEAKEIAKKGIKEIVITGIHLASYGKDFRGGITLINLLEELNQVEGIERIRLGSLEPTLMNQDFISRLVKLDKICDHFHLSLQSGCDETLERMNRKYNIEEFKKGTKLLRQAFPDVSLTTDVIVGFPGETDEEFEKTYQALKEIDFYKMHIFKYSKRKGTKAAVMPNQVDGNIAEQRSRRLIELSNENEIRHNQKQIGKVLDVLFEEQDGEYIKGHTTNYIMVKVPKENLENQIRKVEILELDQLELIGKIIK